MDALLLHPQTKKQIELFTSKPLQALLLIGPVGSGKRTLARYVAARILDIEDENKLASYPYFFNLTPAPPKQEISISSVRQVIHELKHRATGIQQVRRVILLENAHRMSPEAQNALLKTLEEPTANTVFILTALTPHSILPTVASRAHHVYLRAISPKLAARHYKSLPDPEIEKAWHLSGGNAGLLQALLMDGQGHPLKEAVNRAKKFLKSDEYSRLLLLEEISSDKSQLATLLDALSRVLRALYKAQAGKGSRNRLTRILHSWRLVDELQEALQANANPRLVSLELALNLRT